jgi:hypothetical protein
MRRRKLFVFLVVAMLLFTTIAVSSAFCDEGSGDDTFVEFPLEEDGSGGDAGTCGGGDHPGPSGPQ